MFVSVWDPWTRSFTKGVLKRELSGIQVTTFSGVNNLQNVWALKLIFFFQMLKIVCRFRKCKKKKRKKKKMQEKFFVLVIMAVIMAFEPFTGTYLCYEENSFDWQSTCYQTVLRSQIWLRQMFPSSSLSWINEKLC